MLHMIDSYKREFETMVREGGRAIVLDKTFFYPSGGGQPNDTGVIISNNELFVVENVRKDDNRIVHDVNKAGLAEGDAVRCTINWERRYKLMRMHTAAHLLAATVNKFTGALISGNQLGTEESRIDFSLENFDKQQMNALAAEANKYIEKGATVKTYFMKREEAMKIEGIVKLMEKMPSNEELRITEIEGIDIQSCAGTHVKDIREIKKITMTGAENKGKTNRRIYFKLE